MLDRYTAEPIVATADIQEARRFYGEVLGLTALSDHEDMTVYAAGSAQLTVYQSRFAGTNQANAVVWTIPDDLEQLAADLSRRGVKFERYELPGATFKDGVHDLGAAKLAWFKDPDGNILHLVQTG